MIKNELELYNTLPDSPQKKPFYLKSYTQPSKAQPNFNKTYTPNQRPSQTLPPKQFKITISENNEINKLNYLLQSDTLNKMQQQYY